MLLCVEFKGYKCESTIRDIIASFVITPKSSKFCNYYSSIPSALRIYIKSSFDGKNDKESLYVLFNFPMNFFNPSEFSSFLKKYNSFLTRLYSEGISWEWLK